MILIKINSYKSTDALHQLTSEGYTNIKRKQILFRTLFTSYVSTLLLESCLFHSIVLNSV